MAAGRPQVWGAHWNVSDAARKDLVGSLIAEAYLGLDTGNYVVSVTDSATVTDSDTSVLAHIVDLVDSATVSDSAAGSVATIVRDTGGSTFPVVSSAGGSGASGTSFVSTTFSTGGASGRLIVKVSLSNFNGADMGVPVLSGAGLVWSKKVERNRGNAGSHIAQIWVADWTGGALSGVQLTLNWTTSSGNYSVGLDIEALHGVSTTDGVTGFVESSGSAVDLQVTLAGTTANSWRFMASAHEELPGSGTSVTPIADTTETSDSWGNGTGAAGAVHTAGSGSITMGFSQTFVWGAAVAYEALPDAGSGDYTSDVTDSATASDSNTATQANAADLTDSAAASDSHTVTQDNPPSPTDSAAASDSTTATIAHVLDLVDSATVSDSNTAAMASSVDVTDSATVSDSTTASLGYTVAVSDSAAASDSNTAVQASSADQTDSATASDSSTSTQGNQQAPTDSAAVSDSSTAAMASSVGLTDPATVSDSTTAALAHLLNLVDSATASDSATAVQASVVNVVDSATVTDSNTAVLGGDGIVPLVTDSATITDSTTALLAATVGLVDSATTSDSNTAAQANATSLVDSAAASDSSTAAQQNLPSGGDSATVVDSTTVVLNIVVDVVDFATVSDSGDATAAHAVDVVDLAVVSETVTATNVWWREWQLTLEREAPYEYLVREAADFSYETQASTVADIELAALAEVLVIRDTDSSVLVQCDALPLLDIEHVVQS